MEPDGNGPRMPRNRYHAGPVTDHFDGVRFFNNSPPTRDRGLGDLLRWRRTSRPAPWPAEAPVAMVMPVARSAATRITVVGHATVLIQTCGLNIVSDPVWSERASPLSFAGPKRVLPLRSRLTTCRRSISFSSATTTTTILTSPPSPALSGVTILSSSRRSATTPSCADRFPVLVLPEATGGIVVASPMTSKSLSFRPSTGLRAAPSTGAWRFGAASSCEQAANWSISRATPATATAASSTPYGVASGAPTWLCCR